MEIDRLHRAILDAMESETKKIVEEEAQKAGIRVEERVRGMAGEIATQVSTWTSFSQRMQEVVITVKIPPRE